jgi:hypothetical protein
MLVSQRIWRVGQPPERLPEGRLTSERELEEMIVARPEIVSDQWMIIGQQEDTGFGGRIDLLAIAPDSSLVLIELKRGRSPREVVAQAIDYATWVEALDAEAAFRLYARFSKGGDLTKDFEARFGAELDMEAFPTQHQIVIGAASLDASSERIVSYLAGRQQCDDLKIAIRTLERRVLRLLWREGAVLGGSGQLRLHQRRWRYVVYQYPQTAETGRSHLGLPSQEGLCRGRSRDRVLDAANRVQR